MNNSHLSNSINSGINLNYNHYQRPQTYDELTISNDGYPNVQQGNGLSNELRISSLECRIETLEKMVKFYDNLIHLKHEERKNEFNITCNETMSVFNSRIEQIEKKIAQLHLNQEQIYQELMSKIDFIEKSLQSESRAEKEKQNENDNKSDLTKLDSLMYKNELLVNNLVDDKISMLNSQNEKRINDILTIIQDLNKISDENEYEINELKESVRNIQTENVDVIKVVSVHTEKTKQIDFIVEQISELKEKFTKLMIIFGDNQKEEEDFLQNYLIAGNQQTINQNTFNNNNSTI